MFIFFINEKIISKTSSIFDVVLSVYVIILQISFAFYSKNQNFLIFSMIVGFIINFFILNSQTMIFLNESYSLMLNIMSSINLWAIIFLTLLKVY